jgi:hypothetical protein
MFLMTFTINSISLYSVNCLGFRTVLWNADGELASEFLYIFHMDSCI